MQYIYICIYLYLYRCIPISIYISIYIYIELIRIRGYNPLTPKQASKRDNDSAYDSHAEHAQARVSLLFAT